MKKILFIVLLSGFSQITKAQSAKEKVKVLSTDTVKKVLEIDPVCKMKVKTEKAIQFIYDKKTYYFCNESCKKAFSATPEKYIKK